jgi:hypothetical protein
MSSGEGESTVKHAVVVRFGVLWMGAQHGYKTVFDSIQGRYIWKN